MMSAAVGMVVWALGRMFYATTLIFDMKTPFLIPVEKT